MMTSITCKDVFANIIAGLSSSTVFIFLLWNLKPRVEISESISCEEIIYNDEIKEVYLFKVINRSCFFPVYDIKAIAVIIKPVKNLNGMNSEISRLPIEYDSISIVPKFYFKHYFQDFLRGENRLKQRTDYAVNFFTVKDCRSILNDNERTIEFQITAKHALTGFTKVKTMRYEHVLKIENGSFLSGNSFKIVNSHQKPVLAIN